MSRRLLCPLILCLLLTTANPLAAQTMSGHTAGQFQVNESGAATYSIPITVPPGTAGMGPKLALSYSSQGRNSLLGVGWSLSGLSAVSRCPATQAQDGFTDGVDFDASDRFCLDGERLMLFQASGTYGADSSEYRTEQDTFRRVIAYGSAGSGPNQITAWTKSGLTLSYANSTDSRIEAQGKASVLIWAVNRISDSKGNFIDLTYDENNANGEYGPVRIDYTGNEAEGLVPYNSVQFVYEDRPDIAPRYVGGSVLKTTKRLKTIQAFDGEQLYREYRLAYEIAPATGESRLVRVTECGSDGTCFAPTTFGWETSTADNLNFDGAGSGLWQGHGGGVSENVLGDFNGDGMIDIAATVAGRLSWDVRLSTGSAASGGFGGFLDWSGHLGGKGNNITGDFNGDGKTDVASFKGANLWNVCLSNGTDFECDGSWFGHNGGVGNNTTGDFNGDGKTDIASYTGGNSLWNVCLSTGTGFACSLWPGHGAGVPYNVTADFNGDGLSDIAVMPVFTTDMYVFFSTGSSFAPLVAWPSHGGGIHANITGDFNGDGKSDVAGVPIPNIPWDVRLSTGETSIQSNWPSHGGSIDNNILGDFDGNGRTDVAAFSGGATGDLWHVCRSNGVTFDCDFWHGHTVGVGNIVAGDFNGDGTTDIATFTGSGGLWNVKLSGVARSSQLTTITTGHGRATTIAYKPLTDSSVYTKDADAVYPEQDFQGPMHVVSSYATSNGIGGQSTFSYVYGGAKLNLQGRGFRGFDRTTVTDQQTGIATTVFYERDFRCISSKIIRTEQRQPDGTLISEVDNTIVIQDHTLGVHFSYVGESVAKNYELDGTLVSTVTTNTEYDDHGNVLSLSVAYGEGYTETTTNTYDNDFSQWFLGRLRTTEVTKTAPGQPDQTRHSAFEYDPASGLLNKEIIEPDNPAFILTKTYQHNAHGNIDTSTTTGPDVLDRSQTTLYDAQSRYVTQSTNALGHSETRVYTLGNLTSLTGPNLLTTSWEYDGFGRQISEIRADGTATHTVYELCEDACPWGAGAVYFVRSDTTAAPPSVTYFDVLDREIRRENQGFSGTLIFVDTVYNGLGQVAQVSDPYFAGDTPLWTTFTYDLVGRVLTETAPGNRTTSTAYAGRTTTITNPLAQTNTRAVDARGQLVSSADHLGSAVTYLYDAFGNMVQMTDPVGNTTTLTYDTRGNKTAITDPDTGTATFEYNALGQLISQTDATGNTVTITYDLLGRITSRTEPEGVSTWTYDTQPKGIGKLAQISRGDYLEEVFYDSLGRPQENRTTIAGESFSLTTLYDLFGRPDTLIYPTGFGIRTTYNALGYASEVRGLVGNALLWHADSFNARGQSEQITLGNGLSTTRTYDNQTGRIEAIQTGSIQDLSFTWDAIGNLTDRSDDLRGLSESFTYDDLNRLTDSQTTGQTAVAVAYDELGNITSRSGVGSYFYGENGAGPHAVTSIDGSKDLTFAYDANGNLTIKAQIIPGGLIFADGFESGDTSAWGNPPPPSAPTAVSYTSFNKPRTISKGPTTLAFDYGPGYGRYRQEVTTAESTTTKLYLGGVYERETTDTLTKDIHYIRAGGQVIAVMTAEDTGAASIETTRYLHRDHLGSVQTISDETGTSVEVLSFDTWGLRRNPEDWSPATTPIIPTLDRGFTGHEHLDEVSLIHMNGRVYDPTIGRFLSADPFVQAPEFTQSLNRYSYVLNNPLSLTDPSGFFFKSLFRSVRNFIKSDIGRIAISIGVGYLTAGTFSPGVVGLFEGGLGLSFGQAIIADAVLSGAGFGLGAAFSDTLLAGGSIGDALQAGLSSAAVSGLESALLFQIAVAFPVPEALKQHQSLKERALAIADHFKSQLPKIIARGTVKGITGKIRGGDVLTSLRNSIIQDTLSLGRDLVVEADIMKNLESLKGKCSSFEECRSLHRLTFMRGETNLVGIEQLNPEAELSRFDYFTSEQGILRVLNYVPGFNSGAAFHDSFVRLAGDSLLTNQATIAPLIAINYLSLGIGLSENSTSVNFKPVNSF